jgi:ubiquinone/menaquinone biosynthesis C-methylase UbiE
MPKTDPESVTRERLASMMQAYKTTSLLRSGIELGVFDRLAPGPIDIQTLAAGLDVHPRGLRILLNGLAAINLVDVEAGNYRLAPGADDLLVHSSPGYVGDMVHVMASDWEWEALRRLPDAVRNGGTVMEQNAETPGFSYWENFAAFATAVATPTAGVMADALADWARRRAALDVLDIACGHGIYGFTLGRRHPQARMWALDWANVLPVTRRHAERLGVADRTRYLSGDMFEAPLGGPYDVVLVTNVLHHFSEQRATDLLTRASGVLKPDGRLVIVGFTLGDSPPARDPAPHLFSVLMLVWTSGGEVHSAAAYDKMLVASGFSGATTHTVPGLPLRVLIADYLGVTDQAK